MGKRSNFERVERDYYPTPEAAVTPLLSHLGFSCSFSEPCAGNGDLVHHLEKYGHVCSMASDIEERCYPLDDVTDALTLTYFPGQFIITNPPWDRSILHPMIEHFRLIKPTWLLFDADWFHTKQAKPYKPYLHKYVSVGRVKWIEGSKSTGKDNCAWYLFKNDTVDYTEAY